MTTRIRTALAASLVLALGLGFAYAAQKEHLTGNCKGMCQGSCPDTCPGDCTKGCCGCGGCGCGGHGKAADAANGTAKPAASRSAVGPQMKLVSLKAESQPDKCPGPCPDICPGDCEKCEGCPVACGHVPHGPAKH